MYCVKVKKCDFCLVPFRMLEWVVNEVAEETGNDGYYEDLESAKKTMDAILYGVEKLVKYNGHTVNVHRTNNAGYVSVDKKVIFSLRIEPMEARAPV